MSRWRITCIPKQLLPNIAFLRPKEVTDVTSIVGGEGVHLFVIGSAVRLISSAAPIACDAIVGLSQRD
jgi:hypothetical protein